MIETFIAPEIPALDECNEKDLEKASTLLKENGLYDIARHMDIALSHIALKKIETGEMKTYTEEEFYEIFPQIKG